jgi:hypothetical protein
MLIGEALVATTLAWATIDEVTDVGVVAPLSGNRPVAAVESIWVAADEVRGISTGWAATGCGLPLGGILVCTKLASAMIGRVPARLAA